MCADATVGDRNIDSCSMGWRSCSSITRNAAMAAIGRPNDPTINGDVHRGLRRR
jgi:hypothetical protein